MAEYLGGSNEAQIAEYWMKRRQKEKDELQRKKLKIEDDLKIGSISNKFAAHYDAVDEKLRARTVGLVTLDQMKQQQRSMVAIREKEIAAGSSGLSASQKIRAQRKQKKTLLSFDLDEEDEEEEEKVENNDDKKKLQESDEPGGEESKLEEPLLKKKRLGKNPDVDTSFLPDIDREEEEKILKESLRKEWQDMQDKIKAEMIEVVYSYWDGSGHRRSTKVKKGNTIEQFLLKSLEVLRKDYNDLKSVTVDQLMYIKEDLIMPHHYTFYDFITSKARGKTGPLFDFGCDDVRLTQGVILDKEEVHAGKVCVRQWYERHKHIYPANRWEPFDPLKKWTITADRLGGVKIQVR